MKYGFTFLFIVTFSNKGCDISKRSPGVTEYFPLMSCHKDIRAHLRTDNVSQTSILTEKDFILARSGHFEEEGLNMAVCPKHRAELGIFWRPGRNALIRFTGVAKGGLKEERTYKCAKKLWKSGGYLFQSEQVTKQHVILHALNNFLRHADGRLSPLGSQLSKNADNVSSSTARYYKRKAAQVLETVFEAIAPEQSKWLTEQVIEKYCHSTNSEVNTPE